MQIDEAVRRLVDDYRERCLWFLRENYYPVGSEEILQTLHYIEQHGDRQSFVRAAEIRRWLSPNSSGPSAGS